jgi:hypothetical protein
MKARIWSEWRWLDLRNTRGTRYWRYVVPLPRGGATTGGASSWAVAMGRVQATIDTRWKS